MDEDRIRHAAKFKPTQILFVFATLLAFTYLAGYAYWQTKEHDYWSCRAIDGPLLADGCPLKPDGPLGVLLFILIPLAIAVSFVATVFILKKAKKSKK
jgi:hypothetical protein